MRRISISRISLLIVLLFGAVPSTWAFTGDLDSTARHYHLGEKALATGHFADGMREYADVFLHSKTLEIDVREWYRGGAAFGLAYCAAYTNDTPGTRHWLEVALEHHYWMFNALETSELFLRVAGVEYVDSLCKFWIAEYKEKSGRWRKQDAMVLKPKAVARTGKYPTISALHGGYDNLKEFASHWQNVADELDAVVIIPPGTSRPSPVGYGWNFEMAPIDSAFDELMQSPIVREFADPRHVYLAGFSQGGHAAIELALRHGDEIRGAICIEGLNIEPVHENDAVNALAHHSGFYGIYGEFAFRPFLASFQTFKSQCDSLGIQARFDIVPEMIHELPPDLAQRMKNAV